jgi:hypothetical protein
LDSCCNRFFKQCLWNTTIIDRSILLYFAWMKLFFSVPILVFLSNFRLKHVLYELEPNEFHATDDAPLPPCINVYTHDFFRFLKRSSFIAMPSFTIKLLLLPLLHILLCVIVVIHSVNYYHSPKVYSSTLQLLPQPFNVGFRVFFCLSTGSINEEMGFSV